MQLLRDNLTLWTSDNAVLIFSMLFSYCLDYLNLICIFVMNIFLKKVVFSDEDSKFNMKINDTVD